MAKVLVEEVASVRILRWLRWLGSSKRHTSEYAFPTVRSVLTTDVGPSVLDETGVTEGEDLARCVRPGET